MKRIFLQQYFYRRIMRMKRIFLVTKRNSQNSSNSPFYLSRFKSFLSFFLRKRKIDTPCIVESKDFSIFALAISGKIDLVRESAFFALFLRGELGQFPFGFRFEKPFRHALRRLRHECFHGIQHFCACCCSPTLDSF